MFWSSLVGADRPPKLAMTVARQEDWVCVSFGPSLCRHSSSHAVKKWQSELEEEKLMFWYSLVGADRPPKQAMPVAIARLEQEDLGFGVLY